MRFDDMRCQVEVDLLVTFIQHDEKEIEPRHDRRTHGDVSPQAHLAIIPSSDWIRRREDRRPRVQRRLDSGFRNRDCLLFHRFMDSDLIGDVHLVELVNCADAVVGKHERTGFDSKFTRFFVFNNGGGETSGGGGFTGSVDSSRQETADIPKTNIRDRDAREEGKREGYHRKSINMGPKRSLSEPCGGNERRK